MFLLFLRYILICIDMKSTIHIDNYQYEGTMTVEKITKLCKALSDPTRLSIIEHLSNSTQCACHLLEHFDISQPTLSHHMKVLNDCGLVSTIRQGKWNHYSINTDVFKEFKDYFSQFSNTESQECCQ